MSDLTIEQLDNEHANLQEQIRRNRDAREEVVRLNEEKMPRLITGDFMSDGFSKVLIVNENGEVKWLYSNGRTYSCHEDESNHRAKSCGYKRLGNLFDDMEAAGSDGMLLPLTAREAKYIAGYCFHSGDYTDIRDKVVAKLK